MPTPPSTILTDTFAGASGTLLTAHAADTGNSWAAVGTGAAKLDGSNGLYFTGVGGLFAGGTYASGIIQGTASFKFLTNANEFVGFGVADVNSNGYALCFDVAGQQGWRLQRGGMGGSGSHYNGTTNNGLIQADGVNFVAGENFTIAFNYYVVASVVYLSWAVAQGGVIIWSGTATDSGASCYPTCTKLGLYCGQADGTATTGLHCVGITGKDPGAAFSIASPSWSIAGQPATVTLSGVGTNWSGATGIAASAGTISADSASSATAGTFAFAAPATSQGVALTDPASGFVQWLPVLIPATDPNLYYAPGTAVSTGSAPAPRMTQVNLGSYWKANLVGTNRSVIYEVCDTTNLGANDLTVQSLLTGCYASYSPSFKSGPMQMVGHKPAGTQQLQSFVISWGSGIADTWTGTPPQAARNLVGLYAPGCTTTAPVLQPSSAIVYGDSTACGYTASGVMNAAGGPAPVVAAALRAEVGMAAFGGQGWQVSLGYDQPPLFTPGNDAQSAWDKVYSGHARTFPAALNYLIVLGMGTNDWNQTSTTGNDAAITASVAGFLAAARAATNPSCWIVIVPPWQGHKLTAIRAGFNQYQAATPDARAVLCDLSTTGPVEWRNAIDLAANGAAGSWLSADGQHPSALLASALGAEAAAAIQGATTAAASGGSSPRLGSALIRGSVG